MIYKNYELEFIDLYKKLGYYQDYRQVYDEEKDIYCIDIPSLFLKCVKPYIFNGITIGVNTVVKFCKDYYMSNDDSFTAYLYSPYLSEYFPISKDDILKHFVYDEKSTKKFYDIDMLKSTLEIINEEKQDILKHMVNLKSIRFLLIKLLIILPILHLVLRFMYNDLPVINYFMQLIVGLLLISLLISCILYKYTFLKKFNNCIENYKTIKDCIKDTEHELFLNDD